MFIKYTNKILKELKRKITIVLIPHSSMKPIKFNFSLLFLSVCLVSWTGLTLWAGYVSGQKIDYLKIKTDNKIMHLRMAFLSDKIAQSMHMLQQVKHNDEHIRELLAMGSKRVILEDNLGYGGPTPVEANALITAVNGNINTLSFDTVSKQATQLIEEYKASIKSYSEIANDINVQRVKFRYTPSIWPCEGTISSPYGFRIHPILRYKFFHSAIDIANIHGTTVRSTADGIVLFAGIQRGYGKVLVIGHGNQYKTIYAHLSKILVKKGEFVEKGQEVAKMGSSGRSTGSHLHYEIHYKNKPINPGKYLKQWEK